MARAVILGGTGQIGLAVADGLAGQGWQVVLVARRGAVGDLAYPVHAAGARDVAALREVIGEGTDLLLSCVAFDAEDAACLVALSGQVGRIAVVSSASVYCDAAGRTLDEAGECGFPVFEGPLTAASPTVLPGPATYSTRKIAMEQALLAGATCPVTILRPCAIHGPFSKHAREWWFVKRLLDGRSAIPLAYGGESRFQTTSVAAIAAAVLVAAREDMPPIVNVADGDCPCVVDIARAIMGALGREADLIALPRDAAYPPRFGGTPWSIPEPMILRSDLGDAPTYAQSVGLAVTWLAGAVPSDGWHAALPQLAAYPRDLFDYGADDAALALPGARRL